MQPLKSAARPARAGFAAAGGPSGARPRAGWGRGLPGGFRPSRQGTVAASIPARKPGRDSPASQPARGRAARAKLDHGPRQRGSASSVAAHRAAAATGRRSAIKLRLASSASPYRTPEGHTGSHPRHPRQRSKCITSAGSPASRSPRARARISTIRPRGLSLSSPVTKNVGQLWRQKPQCTQGSSPANARAVIANPTAGGPGRPRGRTLLSRRAPESPLPHDRLQSGPPLRATPTAPAPA